MLTLILTAVGFSSEAQIFKSAGKASLASAGKSAAQAAQLSRQILKGVRLQTPLFRTPVLTSIEPNIRRFVFTVEARGQKNGFKGSGFVFADNRSGQTVLWGASAAHTVRHLGKDVTVTFHLNDKDVSFPATVALTGRKFGLNAALIKLPEDAAEVALPVEMTKKPTDPKDALFTYGFSEGSFKKTVRSVLASGEERLLADFPRFGAPRAGFCGSVVLNREGRAVGIETGGYALQDAKWEQPFPPEKLLQRATRVSEIVPIHKLNVLLREYYTPQAGERTILFKGIQVGKLAVDEFIDKIAVHYKNGGIKFFEHSPLWNIQMLENAVPYLGQAEAVRILINKNRSIQYTYEVDLKTRTVTREDL